MLTEVEFERHGSTRAKKRQNGRVVGRADEDAFNGSDQDEQVRNKSGKVQVEQFADQDGKKAMLKCFGQKLRRDSEILDKIFLYQNELQMNTQTNNEQLMRM